MTPVCGVYTLCRRIVLNGFVQAGYVPQTMARAVNESKIINIIHSYPQTEEPSTTISVDSFWLIDEKALYFKDLYTYKQSYPQKG